jgi:hypothetical protein
LEPPSGATFTLERFDWATPDRLEVAGRFSHLRETALKEPVLVVRSGEQTRRLGVAPQIGRPARGGLRRFGGGQWRAVFTWPGPPSSFDGAVLELGDDFEVELPAPGSKIGRRVLEVGRPRADILTGADGIRLQADLASAREEAEEARGRLHETQEAARRLRQDLEAQRKRRKAEAARFHAALESIRDTAEKAVSAERERAEALRAELEEAHATVSSSREEVQRLREHAAAVEAQRDNAAEEARRELEEARREFDAMREELDAAADMRAGHDRLQAELEDQQQQVAELRTELQRVVDELGAQIDRLRPHATVARERNPEEEGTSPRSHAPSER